MSYRSPRAARPRARPEPDPPQASPAPGERPFLRFYHSEELRAETLAVLAALERADDPRAHRAELARVVVALTECGMDAYFLEPLRAGRAGFLVERTARLGISSALRVLSPLLNGILGRMDPPQLLAICSHMRRLMQ